MDPPPRPATLPGRGARTNPPNGFESLHVEADADLDCPPEERPQPRTQFFHDATQSLLTTATPMQVGLCARPRSRPM